MEKKHVLAIAATFFLLVLTACSGSTSQVAFRITASTSNDNTGNTTLSQVNKLLVGTLNLEDTDQAVTAEQATALLPLWQAYRSLSTSQTAAEAEVDALLNQIQSAMSAEQIKAITAMNLTAADMMTLMQSMGGMRIARGTPDPQSTPGFDLPTGGFEGSAPPEGDFRTGSEGAPSSGSTGGPGRNFGSGGGVVIGGGPMLDSSGDAGLGPGQMLQGTPDPSMQATAQARFSTQANQVNNILLDVLIGKLEAKATE